MAFDPYQPYGSPVESTMRVVTWNVWGRYGAWEERQAGLEAALAEAEPDVACLVESWSTPSRDQPRRVAARLGLEHSSFVGIWELDGWTSGLGIVSRWPVVRQETRRLPGEDGGAAGSALFAGIDGPRGLLQLFVVVPRSIHWPVVGSRERATALLGQDPRPPAARALKGRPALRVRVGDHRIISTVDDDVLLVVVVTLGR
ncbi:MAG: endonuclease/exonuclease/phosphatase family protein [Ilumatobacteraceae bacterium]